MLLYQDFEIYQEVREFGLIDTFIKVVRLCLILVVIGRKLIYKI